MGTEHVSRDLLTGGEKAEAVNGAIMNSLSIRLYVIARRLRLLKSCFADYFFQITIMKNPAAEL